MSELGKDARMEYSEEDDEQEDAPEFEGQSYEVAEFVEDALASGEWNEHLKNKYVYSFKQGNRIISDLTAAAYFHIGLEFGISIISHSIEKTDKGVMAYAEAEKIDTKQKHPGVAYQPMVDSYGKFDVFCFQKALTKACRNAVKALIPADMAIAAVEKLSKLTPMEAKALAQPTDAQALPASAPTETKEDTPKARASRRMFAVYREYADDLAEMGITSELFWDGVRKQYNVESRADMTETQCKNVASSLELVNDESGVMYSSWIRDLVPDEDDDTDDSENNDDSDDVSDDAIPF